MENYTAFFAGSGKPVFLKTGILVNDYRWLLIFIGISLVAGLLLWRRQQKEAAETTAPFILRTGRLNLSFNHWLTHFGIVLYILLIPLSLVSMRLAYWWNGEQAPFLAGEVWMLVVPLGAAFFFYRRQRKKLQFHPVTTRLPKDEIIRLMERIGGEEHWTPDYLGDDMLICHTSPSFLSGSGGEQIFVVFDTNRVWLNSIGRLDRKGSVTSFGRTRKQVQRLTDEIRRYEAENKKTASSEK
ncbi:MAG: hypothetical protein LIP00_03500 [Parabacteroides sp.]|nr:hypothetical protein [Parabacteroides sp.]